MGIRHCGAVRCAPEAAGQRGPKRRGDGKDVRTEPPPAGGRHRGTGLGRAGGGLVCDGSRRGGRAAAACQERQCKDCNKCYTDDLFHFSFLLLFFQYENTHFFFVVFHATAIIIASPRKMKNRAHVKYM